MGRYKAWLSNNQGYNTVPTNMNQHDLSKLKTELNYFRQMKDGWLSLYKGQFALIKGEKLIGTYTTLEEAYSAGVNQFGTDPFLVKQVLEQEPPEELSAHFANAINVCL